MFRSVPRCYRQIYGVAISSCQFCRPAMRADNVTKVTAGITHQVQREAYQGTQAQSAQKCGSTGCLRFHHLSSNAIFTNTNVLSMCQPLSLQLPSVLCTMNYSTSRDGKPESPKSETVSSSVQAEATPAEENLSIFQRFKRAYKEHGKILVAVHVATSIVWYGSFYAVARGGVDIVPWMEQWGFSETIIKPFRAGGLGDFAVAYLLYKLATPARYTVTLGGTNLVIRYLRSRGRMAPRSQEDSLRELYKEGRQQIRNSKLRQDRLKKIRAAREKKKAEKEKRRK